MKHQLTEHLTVTDEQYDAAVMGLAVHRPDLALSRARFLDPMAWEVIPGGDGRPSKAELFIHRDREHGHVLLNQWMAPDLRDGERPKPHSHPADFASHILLGGAGGEGYTEMRYTRVNAEVWSEAFTYRQGETNTFPIHLFHEVVDVDPGALTLMCWGRVRQPRKWGYVDPESAEFTRTSPDPEFTAQLHALNPQRYTPKNRG